MPAGTSPTQSSPSRGAAARCRARRRPRRSARATTTDACGARTRTGITMRRRARGAARRRRAGRSCPSRRRRTRRRVRASSDDEAVLAGPQRGGDRERVARDAAARRPSPAGRAPATCPSAASAVALASVGRLEVGHDAVEHQRVVGGVLPGELAVAGPALAEVLQRVVAARRRLHLVAEAAEAVDEQLVEHAVLAAEAGVHVHRAHAGGGGDAPHRQRPGALGGEQVVGRREQRLAGVGGAAATPTGGRRSRS